MPNEEVSTTHSNSEVLGDTALQSAVLEANEGAPNYQQWLASLALPYLGDDPIELGSGLGLYAEDWLNLGVPRITVTEADESRLSHLQSKFAIDPRVTVREIDLTQPQQGQHSCFVSFNVLEHIPDDVAALRTARSLVRPGGYIVSFVPAFEFAMSKFDRQIGHVRRYRVEMMRDKLKSAGLEVVDVRYVNSPGLLAWWLGMRVFRMTPGEGPILDFWDGKVVPRVRRFEATRRMRFGQSVLAIAKAPD